MFSKKRMAKTAQNRRKRRVVQQPMSHNWGRRRNRLRKGKRGITSFYGYGSRATYRPIYNKHRRMTPEWGALRRAWVGYVIAKNQDDYEKMRKYAIVIRKFQRRLNIAISNFLDIGVYGFEDFENKEEDDDSKLAVYDPWSRERTGEAGRDEIEDKNEDEDIEDEDDDSYRGLYRR
jgi:hypothetical protein